MKLIATTTAACLTAALATSASAGVLAHYSFDGVTTDSSGNGNNLTAVETSTPTPGALPTTTGTGAFGSGAASFTNATNDAFVLDSAIAFDGTSAWSTSFWVNWASDAGQFDGMVLGDSSDTIDFIWLYSGGLRYRSAANNTNYDYAAVGDQRGDGYQHYAFSYDGAGSVTLWLNGVSQGSLSAPGSLTINSIGDAYGGGQFSMNGLIDEVWILDQALDQATVDSLRTSNAVPEPGSLALLGLGGLCLLRRRRG